MPARLLVPRRVPVLARTRPRAAGVVSAKRYSSDPVKPGDRQSGEHGPQRRLVGGGGHPEHAEQGVGGQHVVPGQPAAVVPVGAAHGDVQLGQGLSDPRDASLERPLPDGGQPDLVGEHLGRLVVAHRQHPLDDLRHGRTLDLGERRGGAGRATPYGLAGQPDAGRAQLLGEVRRRGQRRVRHPAAAGGGSSLVGPQRGDGGDHAVGDVARLPVRVDLRAGEQGVVVAERGTPDRPGRRGRRRSAGRGCARSARAGYAGSSFAGGLLARYGSPPPTSTTRRCSPGLGEPPGW